MDIIHKIDSIIDKCRRKMQKMDSAYKKLHHIYINSEQRKREKEVKAKIQMNEQDLQKLREHYNGMVRYNENNINAVVKTSVATKQMMNQIQSYQNEIKIYKHRHLELTRVLRDENYISKTQHQGLSDLLTA